MKTIQFLPRRSSFQKELKKRVNAYFKENKIKKTGNSTLYIKGAVMFTLYLLPFSVLFYLDNLNFWVRLFLGVISGVGMAGVGMNVMHDANHGSFSSKKWVNELFSKSIFLLAGNENNWKHQHNLNHHTYTNIKDHDHDMGSGFFLRFSKEQKKRSWHRFQQFYAPFLYGLMTISWALSKDFMDNIKYSKDKSLKEQVKLWFILIFSKIFYYFFWIGLPLLLSDYSLSETFLFLFVMHYTCGLILSHIFQLAHIVPIAQTYNYPQDSYNNWSIHQILTSSNFGTNNGFLVRYTGGLTHQLEHHVFPHISHIHYKKIENIVRETCAEFKLPYLEYKSFFTAIRQHYRLLGKLGREDSFDFA